MLGRIGAPFDNAMTVKSTEEDVMQSVFSSIGKFREGFQLLFIGARTLADSNVRTRDYIDSKNVTKK